MEQRAVQELVRDVFVSSYGEEQTDVLIGETRREYQALIPRLPYIGGERPYTQFIISAAWSLAMYRELKAQGENLETVGWLIYGLGSRQRIQNGRSYEHRN
jgi:hypothetical protein